MNREKAKAIDALSAVGLPRGSAMFSLAVFGPSNTYSYMYALALLFWWGLRVFP
jgi:hypothetical protein